MNNHESPPYVHEGVNTENSFQWTDGYGMVWYGMVWYGMTGYSMVWYGMVWYGMEWYGMVWYGMVCYGMVRYGMVWCGMEWYGMVRYGMVWSGMADHAAHLAGACGSRTATSMSASQKMGDEDRCVGWYFSVPARIPMGSADA